MKTWLKGKKTYFLVAFGVAALIVQAITGDISLMEFVSSDAVLQLAGLLGIGTLRAGVGGK